MDTEYRNLAAAEKIICIVSDFFYITNGNWNDSLLFFVKAAIDALGIEPYELVSYEDIICILSMNEQLYEYLFTRNKIYYSLRNADDAVVPYYEAVMKGI